MHRTLLGALALGGLVACDNPTRPADPAPSTAVTGTRAPEVLHFQARNLGTLGGRWSFAEAINERTEVVGEAQLPSENYRAFLWRQGQGIRSLGTLGGSNSFAADINDEGEVVGLSEIRPGSDMVRAFLWSEARGMRGGLGTLGGRNSVAVGINNRREVVGVSENAKLENRAFLWRPGRGMRSLGTLGGAFSEATDLNDATQVVGTSQTASGEHHAFLWTAARGMEDLGTLGGTTSVARGISETGEIVGWTEIIPGQSVPFVAFLWTRGRGMRSLGTLGGDNSEGTGINTHRQVAANADTARPETTFPAVWTPKNGMQRLPSLGGILGGDFGLTNDINEFGKIVGLSTTARGDSSALVIHATLWTPRPGPLLAVGSSEASLAATARRMERSSAARAALCAMTAPRDGRWSQLRTTLDKACLAR